MLNGWVLLAVVTALVVSLPLLVITPRWFYPGDEVWRHILHNLVPGYVSNTVMLMLGVGLLSLPGAILILSLSLYPYVYLITRAYFLKQSTTLFEVGASLGRGYVYLITRAYFLKQSTTLFEVGASFGRGPVSIFFRIVLQPSWS